MTLPVTKAQQLVQQHESALLDESVRFREDDLRSIAAGITETLRSADMDDRGRLYALMSLTRRRQGRLPEALDAAKNALHTDTTSARYAIGVSAAYGVMGRHKDALEFADRAERLLKRAPDPALGVAIALNQATARFALGRPGAEEAIARAAACAVASPVVGNFKIADVLAFAGRSHEALEFLARHVAASRGTERGEESAAEVLRGAPVEIVERLRAHPALRAIIDAVMGVAMAQGDPGDDLPAPPTEAEIHAACEKARRPVGTVDALGLGAAIAVPMRGAIKSTDFAHDSEPEDDDLPPAPTEQEIAAATEKARRPDGSVNPFALAAALAVPMKGTVRSDGRRAPDGR